MCNCDHDPPTFYACKTVKSRKQHRCAECLRDIELGEQYEYVTGLWEGDFEAVHTCQDCVNLRESMQLECFVHHHLMDDVSERDELTEEMERFRIRRDENYQLIKRAREGIGS